MTGGQGGRVVTFYSFKGGTGRTMALANIAWILAANGKRVLVVDWDLEAPGLHHYFHPFLDPDALAATTGLMDLLHDYAWAATTGPARDGSWHVPYARVEPHALSVAPETFGAQFMDGGSLDLLSAGRPDHSYAASVSTFEWDNFYERLGGSVFLDALRDDMKATYEYVLIDSRTGFSDSADICTIQMPDVLVDCFTLTRGSLQGAVAVARAVPQEQGVRGIRVLPVPMRVDDGGGQRTDAARAMAKAAFEGMMPTWLSAEDGTDYWGQVEIPYRPLYAYEEMLAAFGEESGSDGSLLSAYERLTAVISDGEVTELPPVPESVRRRCRDAFSALRA